tara:strand:- start:1625 stop:1735 length:111 start_codon:yes stop_codon:yes gene_type:complete
MSIWDRVTSLEMLRKEVKRLELEVQRLQRQLQSKVK